MLDEFHFHLKWYQSKWTRETQALSCPVLFIVKSGREELYSIYLMYFASGIRFGETKFLIQIMWKVSRISDKDEIFFLIKAFLMVKNYMHENIKHAVIKHLTKKIKTYSDFQTVTTNNSKHFFKFHIIQYWQFQGATTKWYYTLFLSSNQIIHTISESYYHTRINTFQEFISNITDTFWEFLPNNNAHFSRYQTILTFLESYWKTIPLTFADLISLANNTDIIRELLTNNTTNFSIFHTISKQYWHFPRVLSKWSYSKNFFESSCHTILTLSESYY